MRCRRDPTHRKGVRAPDHGCNRLWIPPIWQYPVFAEDGIATDWPLVHPGSRAVGGAGLIIVEATAVEHRGRNSRRIGQQSLRDPYSPLRAARELGREPPALFQYL